MNVVVSSCSTRLICLLGLLLCIAVYKTQFYILTPSLPKKILELKIAQKMTRTHLKTGHTLLILVSLIWCAGESAEAATRVGFYSSTCPNVEFLVKSSVQFFLTSDITLAPALLRMFFHDCFVQGCDASVLLDGSSAEKTASANTGLRGFEVIMDAKSRVEAACPGIVSCADILALASRDAVVMTNGPSWEVPLGRLDGRRSLASDVAVNFPSPRDSVNALKQKFSARGLATEDLVALSGGHTIGQSDCQFFSDRLYNYKSTGMPDPNINPDSLRQLQSICPANGNGNRRVALDKGSKNTWDTSYFQNLIAGNAVLGSDEDLVSDPDARRLVDTFANSINSFNSAFTQSMVKLSNVGVKTASQGGEIRRMCSVANF
jgi:peroxidase